LIARYREEYNQTVQQYNNLIQTFPNLLAAGLFRFDPEDLFQTTGSTEAPMIS
ncbi:MAG: LemA family protein, partial [Microgenomates group bacterium GW2011_GWA2_44_7]